MDSLPIELLQHIFLFDAPSWPDADGHTPYPPLAVSSRWRNAALTCPELWTDIDIVFDNQTGSNLPMILPIEYVRDWIERSLTLGIRVSFDIGDWSGYSPENGHLDQICELLAKHVARWTSFKYFGDVNRYIRIFHLKLKNAVRLVDLVLWRPDGDAVYSYEFKSEDRTLWPPLSTVLICDWPIAALLQIGGERVTSLYLAALHMELEDFFRLGEVMPNVNQLTLDAVLISNGTLDTRYSIIDGDALLSRGVFPRLGLFCFDTKSEGLVCVIGAVTQFVFRQSKYLHEVKIHFPHVRGSQPMPDVHTFPFWAKLLPPTVTTIRLTYFLGEGELFNREIELQLPTITEHLKQLKLIDVNIHISTSSYLAMGERALPRDPQSFQITYSSA
jgi:hypothetical protein